MVPIGNCRIEIGQVGRDQPQVLSKCFDPARLVSLQCILSLGAPLLQEHKDRLNAALPGRFYELYGLTEGFVTILDRGDAVRKSGSVGVPPPFYQIRIVRDDGTVASKRLSAHPEAERMKGALSAGQLWSLDREREWVLAE